MIVILIIGVLSGLVTIVTPPLDWMTYTGAVFLTINAFFLGIYTADTHR